MRSVRVPSYALLLPLTLLLFPAFLAAQGADDSHSFLDRRHDDPDWQSIQQHLPDPATATIKRLEDQADLLRIRRFPEDALDFYMYALRRGGGSSALMNKIGLVELELHNIVLAQGYFREAIKQDKRSPQGWNNLAATEYLERQYGAAVNDYKHAVKIDKTNAVFHANLSTAYFETKGYKKARVEADEALRLDPLIFEHTSGSGISAHVLSVEDRARFQFEMAKLYAKHGNELDMLHELAMASQSGFDVATAMAKDHDLAKYCNDPRFLTLLAETKMLRPDNQKTIANTAAINTKMAPLPPQ